MDQALNSFLSAEFIIFCVIIAMLTMLTRSLVEFAAKKLSYLTPDQYEQYWVEVWREWFMPSMPLIIGALLAYFIIDYPYPEIFKTSISGRVFYGIFAGLCSGYIYPRVKYYYRKMLPQKIDEEVKNNFPLAGNTPSEDEEK